MTAVFLHKPEPRRSGALIPSVLRRRAYGGVTPVPDSDTLSGVAVALVAMVSLADLDAAAAGVNVTEITQDAPATRLAGQLFV